MTSVEQSWSPRDRTSFLSTFRTFFPLLPFIQAEGLEKRQREQNHSLLANLTALATRKFMLRAETALYCCRRHVRAAARAEVVIAEIMA
jgi:hypothetical protein